MIETVAAPATLSHRDAQRSDHAHRAGLPGGAGAQRGGRAIIPPRTRSGGNDGPGKEPFSRPRGKSANRQLATARPPAPRSRATGRFRAPPPFPPFCSSTSSSRTRWLLSGCVPRMIVGPRAASRARREAARADMRVPSHCSPLFSTRTCRTRSPRRVLGPFLASFPPSLSQRTLRLQRLSAPPKRTGTDR